MVSGKSPLVLTLLLGITCSAFAAEPDPPLDEPHALVISGGVSLGAYEAGLNWALIEYMKYSRRRSDIGHGDRRRPALAAVTGASAGSVNAVLSALAWCSVEASGHDDNAFWHTWLDLDLDGLMPIEPADYGDKDALLSRKPMNRAIKRLECALDGQGYTADPDEEPGTCDPQVEIALRNGCEVHLGLMISRVEPAVSTVAGLPAPSQRFVVPMRLVVEGGVGRFYQTLDKDALSDPLLGNVARLPQLDVEGRVDWPAVVDVIKASSAFPVAFGELELTYCAVDGDRTARLEQGSCPLGWHPRTDTFIDGGVFDNVPLGTARVLAEYGLEHPAQGARDNTPLQRVHYLYIDPDRRRGGAAAGLVAATPKGRDAGRSAGLEIQARFLAGFIETARNYELQAVLRFGGWNDTLARLLGETAISEETCRAIGDALKAAGEGDLRGHFDKKKPCQLLATLPDEQLDVIAATLARLYPSMSTGERRLRDSSLLLSVQARDLRLRRARVRNTLAPGGLRAHGAAIDRALDELLEHDSILEESTRQSITALRYDPFADRQLTLSDRNGPLVGSFLSAFGAFFDRTFREHDYLAGAYDAVYNIARHECDLPRATSTQTPLVDCIGAEMQAIAAQLELSDSDRWMLVAALIARSDLAHLPRTAGQRSGQLEGNAWTWLVPRDAAADRCPTAADDPPPADSPKMGLWALTSALYRYQPCPGARSDQCDCFAELDFTQFAQNLRPHVDAQAIELTGPLARDAFEAESPFGPLLVRAIPRLQVVEARAHADKDDESLLPLALGAASWLTHTLFDWSAIAHADSASVWRAGGNTLPREAGWSWHLIPDWTGVELTRSGIEIGWDPQLRYRDHALRLGLAAAFRTRPASGQGRAERRLCNQQAGRLRDTGDEPAAVALEARCARKNTELGFAALPQFAFRFPDLYPYLGFIGLGGSAEAVAVFPDEISGLDLPRRHPLAFGASLTLGLLGDKLRLTWRKRMWLVGPAGADVPAWNDGWIASVQLTDLPGVLYWLTR